MDNIFCASKAHLQGSLRQPVEQLSLPESQEASESSASDLPRCVEACFKSDSEIVSIQYAAMTAVPEPATLVKLKKPYRGNHNRPSERRAGSGRKKKTVVSQIKPDRALVDTTPTREDANLAERVIGPDLTIRSSSGDESPTLVNGQSSTGTKQPTGRRTVKRQRPICKNPLSETLVDPIERRKKQKQE